MKLADVPWFGRSWEGSPRPFEPFVDVKSRHMLYNLSVNGSNDKRLIDIVSSFYDLVQIYLHVPGCLEDETWML